MVPWASLSQGAAERRTDWREKKLPELISSSRNHFTLSAPAKLITSSSCSCFQIAFLVRQNGEKSPECDCQLVASVIDLSQATEQIKIIAAVSNFSFLFFPLQLTLGP